MKKLFLILILIIATSSTAFAESWILWSKWTKGPDAGRIEFTQIYDKRSLCEDQIAGSATMDWGALGRVIGDHGIKQYCLPSSVNGKEYLK